MIPGAAELVGHGVYLGLPDGVPPPVRDHHAVVVGAADQCVIAARRLEQAGWCVTIVTRERCGGGLGRECRRRVRSEVVCAAGGEYLEAVVLRRVDTECIDACNASALFILSL
jgi:ribulose 1,5-bisphosphate synthetase/thiazole synthase